MALNMNWKHLNEIYIYVYMIEIRDIYTPGKYFKRVARPYAQEKLET